MKALSIVFPFLLAAAIPARAGGILTSYPMAKLFRSSAIVVYCDEKDIQVIKTKQGEYTGITTRVQCTVLKTLKGDIAPGAKITVFYSDDFRRSLYDRDFEKYDPLPPGKALIFLDRDAGGTYSVSDAKLVQHGKVLRFQQYMNPGPMYIAPEPQTPESITLAKGQPYGEKELLDDIAAASKK